MKNRRRILFLGETYRADAITWMNGLKEFGHFEIYTWEMRNVKKGWRRMFRFLEYLFAVPDVKKAIDAYKPHMVIAERTTSFGYLAVTAGLHPVAVAQQGKTDIWPERSLLKPLKKAMQRKCFRRADLLHSWGPVMTKYMLSQQVPASRILEMPKGIDLRKFNCRLEAKPRDIIRAIVTRSMAPEYRHAIILEAFALVKKAGIDFQLVLIGDGPLRDTLFGLTNDLGLGAHVLFTGAMPNTEIPFLLREANMYISMPLSEGVSASLFEAMATGNYPIVSDLEGNRTWINDGQNGNLVPCDDVKALANTVIAAWQNQTHFWKVVEHNIDLVREKASYEKNMKDIARLYHEMIDKQMAAHENI